MVNLTTLIIFFTLSSFILIFNQLICIYLFKFTLLKSFIINFAFSSFIFLSILYILLQFSIILFLIYFFLYLCLQILFLGYCYAPNSSIRFKILDIIIKNNFKIDKEDLFKKYNDEKIFKLRINRLLRSKTITIINNNVTIFNKKIFIIYHFYNFFKKLLIKRK